jgi:hypothetical protein
MAAVIAEARAAPPSRCDAQNAAPRPAHGFLIQQAVPTPPVCTENLIGVDQVMELPKLAE